MKGEKRWQGQTAVVIGSGPSLTQADCALVERSGLPTIAVNSAWQWALFCDVLYAGDLTWWVNYGPDVDIEVEKYTLSQNAAQVFGLKRHKSKLGNGYNSGMLGIEMAINFGADTVLMLGFDASVDNGLHFHGKHTKTANPDKVRCARWIGYFDKLADTYPKANIINCSRESAILRFPRVDLEQALCEHG